MRIITTKHFLFAVVGFLIFFGNLAVPTSALERVSCIRADLAETSCEITTVIPTGSPIRPDFRVFSGNDQVPALIGQRIRVVEYIPTRKERTA